jgi:hypothetical protein
MMRAIKTSPTPGMSQRRALPGEIARSRCTAARAPASAATAWGLLRRLRRANGSRNGEARAERAAWIYPCLPAGVILSVSSKPGPAKTGFDSDRPPTQLPTQQAVLVAALKRTCIVFSRDSAALSQTYHAFGAVR